MEKASDVWLRLDIKSKDAQNIIKWLHNKEVSRYLNEDNDEIESLEYIIRNNDVNLLQYRLNQDGRFFIIDGVDKESIGFINLFTLKDKKRYEIVIVIGDPENWGKGYGYNSLKKCMKEVFFKWRIDELDALIKIENERSIHMFNHLRFKIVSQSDKYIKYRLSFDEYLKSLN
ncbi:MAG: GNAT family protein [Bacilli bacterium]